jgi:UDP-N-acetylmuramate--alanine ligase
MIYACIDDENLREVVRKLPPQKIITFGSDPDSDYSIQKVMTSEYGIAISIRIKATGEVQEYMTGLFGEKNASNTTAVIAYLLRKGFTKVDIQKAIQGFTGAKRRFELISSHEQIHLLDDYAHHPAEIKATIQAARTRFPDSKIVILFQPHTYSRTKELKNEFIEALKQADTSIILPIFASAREKEDTTITSKQLVDDAKTQGVFNLLNLESISELEHTLMPVMSKNCVIVTMGAGDVYKLHSRLIPLMHKIDIY